MKSLRSEEKDWVEGDPVNNGGYGGYTPTFAQMQQHGLPRPPAPVYTPPPVATVPSYTPTPAPRAPTTTADVHPAQTSPLSENFGVSGNGAPSTNRGLQPSPAPATQGAPSSQSAPSAAPAAQGESDFERQLRERYQSSPNAPQFTAGAHAQSASQFVPGANPFTSGFEGVGTPAAYNPAFKGVSAPSAYNPAFKGVAAPAFYAPNFEGVSGPSAYKPGDFSGSNSTLETLDPAVLKSVMDMLANPSAYSSDVAKSTYDRLGGAIDDQFNVDNQKINEDMARRGLSVSSIAGGRLYDSNVARKSAKEDLAGQILTDQAQTLGADKARAIAAAQGLSTDEFNRALQTYSTRTAAGQQGFENQLSADNFAQAEAARKFEEGQQGYQNQLSSAGFNQSEAAREFAQGQQGYQNEVNAADFNQSEAAREFAQGQQGYQNELSSAQFGQSEAARKVAEALQAGQFNEGLATDRFNNNMAAQQFNASEDQRGFDDALQGFTTNRASDAQSFGEGEQKLNDYLGYGQQGFNNQLATQNANNQQTQQLMQMLMALFGGTGGGTA